MLGAGWVHSWLKAPNSHGGSGMAPVVWTRSSLQLSGVLMGAVGNLWSFVRKVL